MTTTLYVPPTAIKEGEPVLLGRGTKVEGKWVSHRTWRLTNPTNGRTQLVCLLDPEMSDDEVAAAYGEAKENFIRDTQDLPAIKSWTDEERKAKGRAIKEYRTFKRLMRDSTNNRIFY